VSEAGLVYLWGEGDLGRIASDSEDQLAPTLIQELSHHRVRQVDIQHGNCAAVTEEGLLFTWEIGVGEGQGASAAAAQQGKPRLGLGLQGATHGNPWPPMCVTALSKERISSVAVGIEYMLVTTERGVVFSSGSGEKGSLGHGNTSDHILSKRVEALDPFYVVSIAAGGCQSLALTACGRVFWWGGRLKSHKIMFECQLLPQLVDSTFGEGRVRSIAASFYAAYAVTEAGVLFSWGCRSFDHDGGITSVVASRSRKTNRFPLRR
jgi:alpha-tubulin suppressor-like RCC1 family protein